MTNQNVAQQPFFAAMSRRRVPILCLLLIFAVIFAGVFIFASAAATNREDVQETLNKVSAAVEAAEPVYLRLVEIVEDEVAAMDSDYDDDDDYDSEEGEAYYDELTGQISLLQSLIAGLDGLPNDLNTSEGKTVRAACEYLTMLRDMTTDLAELLRYSIDMYYSVEPMGLMDMDTDDFAIIADQIWTRCHETKVLMEAITPPPYFAITHNDMIDRITEFRDFGDDFYYACYMEDPLRMYSCVYRMTRIIRMFEICDDNLTADLELQFRQADRRLNGPISLLRSELNANLSVLNNALGRDQ